MAAAGLSDRTLTVVSTNATEEKRLTDAHWDTGT